MRKTIASLLMICTVAFASKNEDLAFILEKMYLHANSEPLLSMLAIEAIGEKQIDSADLVAQFKESFHTEKVFAKLAEPYNALFTAEEIQELREIHENPTYIKYTQQMQTFQENFQTIKDTFKELAENSVVAKKQVVIAEFEVVDITSDNFDDFVSQSQLPVVLDVNAKWCNPCRMMNPIVDEMSKQFKGKVAFAKVDFDSNKDLANQLGVSSLPTILFFHPGETTPAMKNVGYMDKDTFKAKIAQFLKE